MKLQLINNIAPGEIFPVLKQHTLSGENSPLQVKRNIKAIEAIVKQFNEDGEIKDAIEKEIELGNTECFDAKFAIQERKTFEYCQDSEWQDLQDQINLLKDKQKAREKTLQRLSLDNKTMADRETGEVIQGVPFTTIRIINVTLKNK